MIVRPDLQALEPEIYRLATVEQEKLVRIVLGLHPLDSDPNTGAGMIGQPRHLMGPQVYSISGSGLELDKVEKTTFITDHDVRDTGQGPRLKSRRLQGPRRLRQRSLHLLPEGAFSLSRGSGNCSLLRD